MPRVRILRTIGTIDRDGRKWDSDVFAGNGNVVGNLTGKVVVAHIQACFANEASLYEQLTAAQTIEDLEAIDITSGF